MPLSRPTLRRLLALAGGAVVAVLVGESLLAGPFRPEVHTLRDEAWRDALHTMHSALYQPDLELVYVPRPGSAVAMEYGEAAFTTQGLREAGEVGPPGADRRVLVVGDSLVWGELLPREQAFPAALDAALGEGFEALNLGVSGYDTAQEAGWYLRAGRPLRPDVVVVVYCLNDTLIQSGPYEVYADAAGHEALAAERAWLDAAAPVRNETVNRLWWEDRGGSQLLAALRHLWRWHGLHTLPGGYVDDYLLAARDPARVARTTAALADLGAAIHADGARAVLVVSPALYWWHRYQWGEVHEVVHAAGVAAGFEVVEPLDAWRGEDPTPFRFPGDNLHYTAAGTRRLADVVARAVR